MMPGEPTFMHRPVEGIGRREFMVLSAVATAWPFAAAAQLPGDAPLLGVVSSNQTHAADHWADVAWAAGLAELEWIEGVNLRVERRGSERSAELAEVHTREMVELGADVILATTTFVAEAVLKVTRTIPVVFVPVADPVGAGFVESYAHPGGNATGFTNYLPAIAGKWLDLLLQIAPDLRRVGMIYRPETTPGLGRFYVDPFFDFAHQLGVQPLDIPIETVDDIGPSVGELASVPNSGLVVPSDLFMLNQREIVISAVAQHRLPAIYPQVDYTDDGGLISYSTDTVELYRRAGLYLGRILNGESPADLPVQSPEKLQLVVNLRTANELGITIPNSIFAAADRFIE